jgi:hypothetical protein
MPPGRLGEYPHRAMGGVVQFGVELSDQVSVQRKFGHRADSDTHDGENDDLSDQQPKPKGPSPAHASEPA